MNNSIIYFFLISISLLIFVNYYIVKKPGIDNVIDNFIDNFIDYRDYISIPTSAYDKAFGQDGKKYFVEFDDKFFKDVLDKSLYSQSFNYEGYKEIKVYNREDIKTKVSAAIESVLNRKLPVEETNLFNVVDIGIEKVLMNQNNKGEKKYVVSATSLIHRLSKAYGLSLSTETFHDDTSVTLVKYTITGFVFDDKLVNDNVEPANLDEHNELTYENLSREKIMKDKKYEHDTFCKYITDLKKFRNIEYPGETGC